MPLLAEGQRKIAMLAFLILNDSLARHGTIYWDEPETNLNPRLMVGLAKVLVQLAASGVQLFIATHSLFLMREIALQLERQGADEKVPAKYFSLIRENGGVVKEEGEDIDDLTTIPALDAAIAQDEALERQYWKGRDA
jgi:AAA15 family ATPase/GTPase